MIPHPSPIFNQPTGRWSIPLSILDLAPIVEGGDAAQSFARTVDLARSAERLGYRRFWLAEHHGMPGIASAATAVLIGHVAGKTSAIRVGAGGIMLPNHSPIVIAEQFGTLETLYPGRIDLGLGRAPGSDHHVSRALRRGPTAAEAFPQDVVELLGLFGPPVPDQVVQAVPGAGLDIPVWILGSSLFGAQLAAALGLPFAFASHFAPAALSAALDTYRSQFRPSDRLERPYVMLGVNVFAADTAEEARVLFSSLQQAFVNLRHGRPGRLQPPDPAFEATLTSLDRHGISGMLSCTFVGTAAQVRGELEAFIERTGADELMVAAQIFDPAARIRSYQLLAEAGQSDGRG
ncbi:MAG TPA: LLM class flavin-dependent oxidoreductase [Gemmatimonadales bacterium]|nr:LLM class flavin-dependent oxidoreductase [Gemmatimonadales bacterium]